jgi:hypothetical protein
MVSEVINECMDYGIVTQLKQHLVLERIHSKYLPPKPSLLPIVRPATSRSSHFRYANSPKKRLYSAIDRAFMETEACGTIVTLMLPCAIAAVCHLLEEWPPRSDQKARDGPPAAGLCYQRRTQARARCT